MSAVEGTCNHFVTRKKRLCRMSVRAGATYCGEHEPKIESNGQDKKVDSRERIACPLDSKHTCYASKLEKHLKVCNARQKDLPPYIRKGCNISGGSAAGPQAGEGVRRSLANVSRQVLHEVVAVVEKIYDSVVSGNISPCVVRECHPAVAPELERDGRGEDTRRHLLQASALLHLLKEHALLAPATCFLELGAGKGHLSYYLAKAVESLLGCSVVLVDRASHRHKQDNRLRVDSSVPVQRIRADISDLLLGEVGAVHNSTALVAVSKHLCGVATDLALNCVTHEAIMEKSAGVAMATCCHHRCLWGSYVGRPFLEEKGVSQSQFDVMCGLVSWATCGSGLSRERRAQITNCRLAKKPKYDDAPRVSGDDNNSSAIDLNADKRNDDVSTVINNVNVAVNNNVNRLNVEPSVESAESESDSDVSRDEPNVIKDGDGYISASKHLGLNVSQREEIGFKAKAILDWGRLLFLRSKNFDANLCFYVDKSLSPENVCIVAVKKKT